MSVSVSISAFLPSAPLVRTPAQTRYCPPLCTASPPRPSRRPLPAALVGAVAGALAVVFSPFVPLSLAAPATETSQTSTTSKGLRYDGRQELEGGQKAMSLTLTAGTFAVLGVWAWNQNRRDDELESVRIKEEVERLDKLRAEFLDVEEDEESMDDEDLLASLKQRISDDAAAEEEGEGEGEGEGAGVEATATDGSERPAEEKDGDEGADTSDENSADAGATDSLDMLKRMWDATDDDDLKKRSKS